MTEDAWRFIAPLLPTSGRGGQGRNHHTVINGIVLTLRSGAAWRDLPEPYGPWKTCADRLYADLVGARNIALRTLLARQDWVSTCVLSERPDVSSEEAKVMRRRHTALRWSLDTSSHA